MLGRGPIAATYAAFTARHPCLRRDDTEQQLASSTPTMQDMHMHRIFVTDEAKKKLWRPCREARALGL